MSLSYKILSNILISSLIWVSSNALAVDCDNLAEVTSDNATYYYPRLIKEVTKKGRLYFYDAPHEKCRSDIFIIKGDAVITYEYYNGFDLAMFINLDTGEDFVGWLPEKSLKTVGTIGGVEPDDDDTDNENSEITENDAME